MALDKSHRTKNIKAIDRYASLRVSLIRERLTTCRHSFTRDLTELAEKKNFDPVLGRRAVILQVIEALSRRKKPNVILLGDPGVGKTALVEGLAQRIVAKNVPESIHGARILEVAMGALRGGATYHGEYEGRVKALLNDLIDGGSKIILFIDEIHLLMSGQGYRETSEMDAANLFKPALARGKFHCVGATTAEEYEIFVQPDQALVRRFACVHVNEPSIKDTETILRGLRKVYEKHHKARISDASIVAAAGSAKRYLPNGRLPDAAITLIDDACVSVVMSKQVGPREIDKCATVIEALEWEMTSLEEEHDRESASRRAVDLLELVVSRNQLALEKRKFEQSKKRGNNIIRLRGDLDKLRTMVNDAREKGDKRLAESYQSVLEIEEGHLSKLVAGGDPTSVTAELIAELVQSRRS
ncbi:P-loop containing nucleoside triphosphate hydrolase protein [Exidia glandulosa HHB12029]|uniref:p-loop containing nucleoside triphosphate hydrolase protein n=1 Tax=Exidia glandulosa HHB12029 TaxID=1314781 RepID=A0A165JC97_EXIGL|nr:P-loop containing nucleoside triphosphate hydrolase protein [Exidia glandulosa HHB12029]